MGSPFIFLFVVAAIASIVFIANIRDWAKIPSRRFPDIWRKILSEKIEFYKRLDPSEKTLFEYKVEQFLRYCKIRGVETSVTDEDIILIASSAIIPIFAFPDWKYRMLDEIILYPDNFNENYKTGQTDSLYLGLVGFGYLDRKLLISRKALFEGYDNFSDKRNTCIHEFIHLIDKEDGKIDGIPEILLPQKYTIPWMFLMNREIRRIKDGYSDIHPYAAKNAGEFLAVISEYFFERPDDFRHEHPELFNAMRIMFKQPLH